MRNENGRLDFQDFGKALKDARKKAKLTREQVGAIVNIDPRYLTNIENKGQNPSLQVFFHLVTLFHLSVDEFFYPEEKPKMSSKRRQFEVLLNQMDDKDIIILQATAHGILDVKQV